MDTGSVPASLPFRLAAAYNAGAVAAPTQRLTGVGSGAPRVLTGLDTVELSAASRPGAANRQRLVAARVDVAVDFGPGRAASTGPSEAGVLAMYRHPADKNAAATAVNVGRSVDLRA